MEDIEDQKELDLTEKIEKFIQDLKHRYKLYLVLGRLISRVQDYLYSKTRHLNDVIMSLRFG